MFEQNRKLIGAVLARTNKLPSDRGGLKMGFEVDFLSVGDGQRSGDAIALRLGNLHGPRDEQVVMIIDGGTTESGERLAEHVRHFYRTTQVDFALLTHPGQ